LGHIGLVAFGDSALFRPNFAKQDQGRHTRSLRRVWLGSARSGLFTLCVARIKRC